MNEYLVDKPAHDGASWMTRPGSGGCATQWSRAASRPSIIAHAARVEIHFSDEPIAREVSQEWNVNLSFAADGSVVEIVILDAVKAGFMPFENGHKSRTAA
jgi:hypothetical protein